MSAAHSRHKARRATHADRIGAGGKVTDRIDADRANGFRRLLGIREKRRSRAHHATHRHARNLAHRAQRTRREPPPYQPKPRPKPLVDPPSPPIPLTPLGGVQSGHTAGRAMAYRGIRAATAQMAGRQSFRNTGDVGLSCASRRAGRGPHPANTAGIVGIVRIASMQLTLARRAIAR